MKKILLLFIILSLFSCSQKKKEQVYNIGGFYANNHFNAKDSSNQFQQNCNFLLMLKNDSLEIYNRHSESSKKKETIVKFKLDESERIRLKDIVNKSLKLIKPKKENEEVLYCGLTYVLSIDDDYKSNFAIASYGIPEEDEEFIFKLIKKSESMKKTKESCKMRKEKYDMHVLLQEENNIETENVSFRLK